MPRAAPKKKAEVLPRPPYNPTVPIGYWTSHEDLFWCVDHKPALGRGESIIGLNRAGVDRCATNRDEGICCHVCGIYL